MLRLAPGHAHNQYRSYRYARVDGCAELPGAPLREGWLPSKCVGFRPFVLVAYDGRELTESGSGPKGGYLAVELGEPLELLGSVAPGHARNQHQRYRFARVHTKTHAHVAILVQDLAQMPVVVPLAPPRGLSTPRLAHPGAVE